MLLMVDIAIIIILGSAVIVLASELRRMRTKTTRLDVKLERTMGTKFKVDNLEARVRMLERDNTRVQRALQQHDMEVDDGK